MPGLSYPFHTSNITGDTFLLMSIVLSAPHAFLTCLQLKERQATLARQVAEAEQKLKATNALQVGCVCLRLAMAYVC